ncbi:hypothetical protein DAI22_03g342150 [Oryza sativa Japonica Group]|nr:hypothetical protein DAI22_03g342150 [Oryza sativa Japonica Group]
MRESDRSSSPHPSHIHRSIAPASPHPPLHRHPLTIPCRRRLRSSPPPSPSSSTASPTAPLPSPNRPVPPPPSLLPAVLHQLPTPLLASPLPPPPSNHRWRGEDSSWPTPKP